MKPSRSSLLWGMAVGATLLLVLAAYMNPHLAVQLANAVWACF